MKRRPELSTTKNYYESAATKLPTTEEIINYLANLATFDAAPEAFAEGNVEADDAGVRSPVAETEGHLAPLRPEQNSRNNCSRSTILFRVGWFESCR